jgi:hypothetical protein
MLALAAVPVAAEGATTTYWITGNGQFTTPTNWSAGVPTSVDTAVFRRGVGITDAVTLPGGSIGTGPAMFATDRAVVGNNFASFVNSGGLREPAIYTLNNTTTAESGRGLVVGELATDTAASLTTTLLELRATAATIADAAGSNGTLNVNNGCHFFVTGSDAAQGELIVANRGTATLNINPARTSP